MRPAFDTTGRAAAAAVLVALIAMAPVAPIGEFWINRLNYVGLAAIVALGRVLLTGVAGLTSFGQAAFVGVGAYTTAYLGTQWGVSPWLTLWASLALTGTVAALLAMVTLRMSGHFLPLGTMAWGLSLYYLMSTGATSPPLRTKLKNPIWQTEPIR